jgi:hypothetical protein
VSLAVCKAGAAEKGVPLYRHIADLAGNPDLILPVPVSVTVSSRSLVTELHPPSYKCLSSPWKIYLSESSQLQISSFLKVNLSH